MEYHEQTNNGRDQTRRAVVQGAIAGGLATLGLAGTVPFSRARAAADASKWPKDAFSQKTEAAAIKALYGKTPEASDKVSLDAPEIAENGAVVPISVATTLPGRHLDLDRGRAKTRFPSRRITSFRPAHRLRSPTG